MRHLKHTDMTIESPGKFWKDYELIDSGNFEKLERFGQYIMSRPEPKALWDKSMSESEWNRLIHTRFKTGAGFGKAGKEDSGTWEMLKRMNDQWTIRYGGEQPGLDFRLRLGLTSFKHVGVFPEQSSNWEYIYRQTKMLAGKAEAEGKPKPKVLNLFAYTGAASLAAKAAGADVTHLDSVRQVVTWARENMELSHLDNIRWVVEDALKFARREARRGNVYQGIILDPPAYGHGPDGEKCLFERVFGSPWRNCRKTGFRNRAAGQRRHYSFRKPTGRNRLRRARPAGQLREEAATEHICQTQQINGDYIPKTVKGPFPAPLIVENTRVELVTSCMPCKRSSQLS